MTTAQPPLRQINHGPVPWDKAVILFEAGPHLSITEEAMTMRAAIERFAAASQGARWSMGVGMHEPYLTTIGGRPVAVGFLNAHAMAELVDLLP